MKGKITAGRILIKPIIKEVTESGIILPDSATKADAIADGVPPKGEVILIGAKTTQYPQEVKLGDIIYYRRAEPFKLKNDGEILALVNPGDIMYIEENNV